MSVHLQHHPWDTEDGGHEVYGPATTIVDAHSQWHAIHGAFAVCPLDCGAGGVDGEWEALSQGVDCFACGHHHDPNSSGACWEAQCLPGCPLHLPQVSCGHCKGRHTVSGVAVCAATHYLSKSEGE